MVLGIFTTYIELFVYVVPVKADELKLASQDDVSVSKKFVSQLPPGFVDEPILIDSELNSSDDSLNVNEEHLSEVVGSDDEPVAVKTFLVSAYYSPLPNQSKYVTGSYAGDIKLNGDGVKAADGTLVYPGMVAAPKGYPFGYKMLVPGIGTVSVHDRGGAIVHEGVGGNNYDRLDVWMGYGEAGLKRALKWGKRKVAVALYGVNPNIKESVVLEGYTEEEKLSGSNILNFNNDVTSENAKGGDQGSMIFGEVLTLGANGDKVKELQEKLKALNYYFGEINGVFDEVTLKAVKKYQMDKNIIDSENSYGAGYVGPKTVKVLAMDDHIETVHAATEELPVANYFKHDLKPGDQGDNVRALQEELKKMNLLGIEPTGIYGEITAHAVFKFQQINMLVFDENSPGAGVFGSLTRENLNALIAERLKTEKLIADRKKY